MGLQQMFKKPNQQIYKPFQSLCGTSPLESKFMKMVKAKYVTYGKDKNDPTFRPRIAPARPRVGIEQRVKSDHQKLGCSAMVCVDPGPAWRRCARHPIYRFCSRHHRVYMCEDHQYCSLCDVDLLLNTNVIPGEPNFVVPGRVVQNDFRPD